jgi:signal transduction histidine kinase
MIAFDGSELSLRRVDVAAGQPATLFVGSIDRLAPRGQNELLEALDGIGGFTRPGHTTLRVITSACADLEELVENHSFSHELYYKLSALVVHQPPLRERPEDIPALVRMLSAELAARLGLGTVRFTSAALRCLGDYLWPGNIDELEAVLGRTLSIRGAGPLDRDDLLFEGTSLQGRHKATGVALSPPPARSQSAASIEVAGAHLNGQADLAQQLDMVINELAHEFRNPLVTIKSFAQHCNKALKKGDEQRFAALTGEAVDRMDQTMENLLHFTRLGHPAARDVGLDTLLEPVFSAQKEALAIEKRGLEYDAPPSIVTHVDPDQTAYAFDNLLRALTRGLTPGESLSAQYCAPGAMLLQLSAGAKHLGDQLSGLIDHADSESSLPLGVAIANAVLERNGVHMSVSKHADPTTVMIHFPVVEKVEAGVDQNGTSTRAHRR